MMKIISNTICLSVFSLVCPAIPFASLPSAYASLVDTSQNQTFESEPPTLGSVFPDLEPAHSFKLAAVHFITNDNALNFGNQEFLPADLCKQGGYTHNGCSAGYVKGEPCPYDSKFVKDCIDPDTWCKNNGYAITSCSVPKYPANPCPYKSSLYKSCETDNIRVCKELGFSLTCETGKVGGDSCPYNSSYKKCICNPCSGYDYTAAQASAQGYVPGEVCNSCGTVKYKRTENACDGYKACDCGGEAGAKICYSGATKKFDTCKTCCTPLAGDNIATCTMGYSSVSDGCNGTRAVCNKCINQSTILYSDKTMSQELVDGKTPIAVVIDCDKKYAMSLQEKRFTIWQAEGTTAYDIPGLTNCPNENNLNNCATDGKANTQQIINHGKSKGISYPVAQYAYDYTPTACASGSWCSKGNWYLPSMKQIKEIGLISVNSVFYKLRNLSGVDSFDQAGAYPSSNEASQNDIWWWNMYQHSAWTRIKNKETTGPDNNVYVIYVTRPFINF